MLPLFLIIFWLVKKEVKVANLKEFLRKRGIVGVFGGLWAMVPDVDYFLDENLFHNLVLSDIFFLHPSLDKVLPENDLFFAAEILLIFAAVNLFAMAATVDSFKRLSDALFGKRNEDEDEEEEEEEENQDEGIETGDDSDGKNEEEVNV